VDALIEFHYEEGTHKVDYEVLVDNISNLRVRVVTHIGLRVGKTFSPH